MEPTKRYDIKDAAHYLGVTPPTLRYWESEGLIRTERNARNEYRQYSFHDIIAASEVVFYRKLGVPVKELKQYRELTISALDEALGRTEQGIQERLDELIAIHERLTCQRMLNAHAERLRETGMQPGRPEPYRFVAIDYDDPEDWVAFVNEPWRYGIIMYTDRPDIIHEAVIDNILPEQVIPGNTDVDGNALGYAHPRCSEVRSHSEDTTDRDARVPLWSAESLDPNIPCLECILHVDPDTNTSDADMLLEEARSHAMNPAVIVASYLFTAAETPGGRRLDTYRAWIIGVSEKPVFG